MTNYSEYFKFDRNSILDYIKDRSDYFKKEEELEVAEIGDGNINYVYRIWSKSTGRSLIVKQADELLRSSKRPLDVKRNMIEAEVLQIHYQLSGGKTPEVYKYDDRMNSILMEDIGDYKNLRLELLDGKIYRRMADEVSSYLVDTLVPSTDLVLDPYEKKDRQARYVNKDMCDISEDLVFTEPFNDYRGRNIILEENLDFVEENIYQDKKLHLEAGKLKDRFKNYSQSLIHGDLHSGSIFINKEGIKVIDPEFAFYGPIGYDLGNVLGNLSFPLVRRSIIKDRQDPEVEKFLEFLSGSLVEVLDGFKLKFEEKFKDLATDPLTLGDGSFLDWYLEETIADAVGMAGLEILRRTIGDSKVVDITGIKDRKARIEVERSLILIAKDLIVNRQEIKRGQDYIDLVSKYN